MGTRGLVEPMLWNELSVRAFELVVQLQKDNAVVAARTRPRLSSCDVLPNRWELVSILVLHSARHGGRK